jgi:Fe-S-cluster-containing dehydrogenase component
MGEGSDPNIFQKIAMLDAKRCTGCKVCEMDCPYDAIHIFRQDQVPGDHGVVIGLRHTIDAQRVR